MDVTNLEIRFNKALRFLDFGKIEQASDILNEIISESKTLQDSLFFIRASCVLGELLFSNGKINEAKQHLINVVNTPYENDVVDYEKSIASDILNQING
jgi:predicted Zn-dependent protease